MQPVADQVFAFFILMLLGNLVGIIYDIYRLIRRIRRLKRWGTNLGDALFWLACTIVTYLFLFYYTWGEVRIYVFIAMVLGLIIYFKFFSSGTLRFLSCLYGVFRRMVLITVIVLKPPLRFLTGTLLFPFRFFAVFLFLFCRGLQCCGGLLGGVFRHLCQARRPPAPPEGKIS